MGKKLLLDTNILVLAVRDSPIWNRIETKFEIEFCDAYISIVSQAEILSLANQFEWGERKKDKLQEILNELNIINIDALQIVNSYIDIDLYSQKQLSGVQYPANFTPKNMGKNDLWIAATANATNIPLLSTDKDFSHLHEIFIDFIWVDITGKE
jgi:predicted nucleic acid-binding protein